LERLNGGHRPEDLLLHTARRLPEARDHRGLKERSFVEGWRHRGASAAAEDLAPFLLGELDVAFDLGEVVHADQGSELRGLIRRVADLHAFGERDETLGELLGDAILDEDAAAAEADLALVAERGIRDASGGGFEVAVG